MNHRLLLEDVIALRDEAFGSLAETFSAGAVCTYQMAGGGAEDTAPWNAVGFFCELVTAGKLVFELLYMPDLAVCVVRVYREEPLHVCSIAVIQDRDCTAHKTAAATFAKAASTQVLTDVVAQLREAREMMASELGVDVGPALYPLPPPVPSSIVPPRAAD